MISNESLLEARFQGLEPALMDELIGKGKVIEAEPGDVLMQVGQPITATMLVLDGRIKIYREDEQGNEFLMYYLEPGAACAFSIMCAMNQELSQITAVAESEVTLLAVPFQESIGWMRRFPSWDEFVLRNYRKRFEELLLTLDHIAFRSMDERLAFYLQRRVKAEGPELIASHQEIARDLNTAREVVSRLLKKLEQRGAVSLERNKVIVVNPDFLTM